MSALRKRLEDAVVTALAGLTYLKACQPYSGEIGGARDAEQIRAALNGRVPGVLVSTRDGKYTGTSVQAKRWTNRIDLALLVVSGNLRSQEARQRGDVAGNDPGIYQMTEDIRDALAGKDLDVDGAGFLVPSSEEVMAHLPGFTAWQLIYSVDTDANAKKPTRPTITEVAGSVNIPAPDDAANPVLQLEHTVEA